MKKIVAVIPTKNEEQGIGKVIRELKPYVDEIYIVDYNSTDKTREIAKKLGTKIIIESNKGYGRAYKTGFKRVKADIIVTLDADGSYSVKNLGKCIQLIRKEKYDFISCNRRYNPGSMSFSHKFGNNILTIVTNLLFNTRLKDSQSGMWIFNSKILRNIELESDGMSFSEEIKIKVIKTGFKFLEIPVDYYKRIGEVKLNTFKDGLNNLIYLFKLWIKFYFFNI